MGEMGAYRTFANALNVAIHDAGLTHKALGEKLGVGVVAVSRWANGRAVPRKDRALRLAALFGKNPNDFGFDREGVYIADGFCGSRARILATLEELPGFSETDGDANKMTPVEWERYCHKQARRDRIESADSILNLTFADFEARLGPCDTLQTHKCTDDVMAPTIVRQDILVYAVQSSFQTEGLYLLDMNGIKVCRRLLRVPTGILIGADNDRCRSANTIVPESQIHVIGRVVGKVQILPL